MMRAHRPGRAQAALTAFVVSANLRRRHLTASQKAMVAVDLLPLLEEEAKERLKTSTGGAKPRPSPIVDEAEKGRSDEQAGKAIGVGKTYVADAKKLSEQAPDLAAKVRAHRPGRAQATLLGLDNDKRKGYDWAQCSIMVKPSKLT